MCELFAISSKKPTAVTYSLNEFAALGSGLRHNRDGWGIAYAKDRDAFLVKEPKPAANSIWAKFVADNALRTNHVIAHVRYATRGNHTMENTHPFRRALGRHTHFFAHNGTLRGIEEAVDKTALTYRPIGETDSEIAFCLLLSRLKPLYASDDVPPVEARLEVFTCVCHDMKKLGSSNFLYFDGEVLFAHAHRRLYEEGGEMVGPKPPGLHIKKCWACADQKEVTCPGLKVKLGCPETVILASVPLDDRGWEKLDEGAILAIRDGEILNS